MRSFIWSKLHNTIKLADSLNALKNQIRVLHLSDVIMVFNVEKLERLTH